MKMRTSISRIVSVENLNRFCKVLGAVLLVLNLYLAGKTVVLKYRNRPPSRPTICDRTGKVLLRDLRSSLFSMPVRHAECGGRFASSLLGHTVFRDGARKGALGVERMIDRDGLTRPELFLTMDAGVQEKCESLLDGIVSVRAPSFTYITVLDSDGGLIAAAQRPSMDLNDRSRIEALDLVFMAPSYVFPVSDAWMRLLGSSSYAKPTEKLKFRFNRKTGVFPAEARGVILGLKYPELKSPRDAQSATVINYLLAYIGVTEGKEIPELKVFLPDAVPGPARTVAGEPHWVSLLWSQDRSTLSALGTIPSDSGTTLYALLRVVYSKYDPDNGLAEKDELLEKEVRAFARSDPPR